MNPATLSNYDTLATISVIRGILITILIFTSIYYIYMAICLLKIAKKTRTPDAWFAWVPILNFFLMTNIAKKPGWWVLLFFIPFINLIIGILVWMEISKAVGKPEWLGILMIITPINFIIPGYLAFSKSQNSNQGPTVIASI